MDINLTLIGQAIAMTVFVAFCMKYVWPFIMSVIEERQTAIANGSGGICRPKTGFGMIAATRPKATGEARAQARAQATKRRSSRRAARQVVTPG